MMIQANWVRNNVSDLGNPDHNMDQDNFYSLSGFAQALCPHRNIVFPKPSLDQQSELSHGYLLWLPKDHNDGLCYYFY